MIIEILTYIIKGIFQILMWTWWLLAFVVGIMAWQNLRKSRWIEEHENVVLSVKVPKNNEQGPTAAEMMFASLHGILKPEKEKKKEGSIQEHFGFEIVSEANSITFYVWTPKHLQDFIEGQIYAQYPTAEVVEVKDYTAAINPDAENEEYVAGTELKLAKPDYYPIKTFMSFEVDPLAGITGALSKIESESEKVWIQILARPASDKWRNKGVAFAESVKRGTKVKITTKKGLIQSIFDWPAMILIELYEIFMPAAEGGGSSSSTEVRVSHDTEIGLVGVEEKANKLGFQVKIRIMYVAKDKELAKERLRMAVGAFKQFNTTNLNGFISGKIKTGSTVLRDYRARLFADQGFVLNIEEVASLYHLPHTSVATPSIVWTSSKKGEPPANLPYVGLVDENDLTVFAETTFRGKPKPFGIKRDDRRRHMYIIGKSGVGKSKLLELLAISDIKKGEGVAVVDPHGETIANVMKHIPDERLNDVIYFNPADKNFPVGFNPLETTPDLREETASGFISVFKRLFGYSWGPRLEYVLRYTVLALTYSPDATMLGVVRMLTDKNYRKKVVSLVEDPVVKSFWLKEFTTYNDRFATEAVAPILNKVGQFTASPIIRNMVGQVKSTVDFKEAMDNQKILLVDLSTGKIGEDNSQLLGSMIITRLQLAAMTRAKIKEEERKDFFLYVDEFQNFATESFATILSEARKYRLDLTLANQYIAQMDETVRDAVFGNVGTIVSFRVGATDATFLEKEFAPVFDQNDLINLDNRHLYIRMLIDGVTSIPFSSMTITTHEAENDNSEKIISVSRERYGVSREEIEDKIAKWSAIDSVDVDQKIENQNVSKFEMTDEQLERGDQPNRKKKKKNRGRGSDEPRQRQEEPQIWTTQKSHTETEKDKEKESSKKDEIDDSKKENHNDKKPVTHEEMKNIIKKVTTPSEIKTNREEHAGSSQENRQIHSVHIAKSTAPVSLKDNPQLKEIKEKLQQPEKSHSTHQSHDHTTPKDNSHLTNQVVASDKKEHNAPVLVGAYRDNDDNIREISKEEFRGLKEIQPNEKIIIKDESEKH